MVNRWALAALAGLLNGTAFIYLGAVAVVANVPLLVALGRAPGRLAAAGLGGLVGLLGGMHIYGILDYGWLLFVGFSLYTASQMVLYALAFRWLDGRAGRAFDVLLPALLWTVTEWVRTLGPLAMPASYVGCIADVPALRPWLWLAPWIGGLGVSGLVGLTQSAVFHLVARRRSHARPALVALGGVLVAGALSPTPPLGERTLQVVGVQGGLANAQYQAAQIDALARRDIVQTYATLTRQAFAWHPDLVVWPETALRLDVLGDATLRALLAPPPGGPVLLAGLLHREGGQAWNLAVALGPGGQELGRYAKVRTVPRTEDYLTRGTDRRPIATPVGAIGVLICLESVYPDAGRDTTRAGAEILAIMSNDAGFGRSPITKHMTARAIVRAVENGRWLIRVGQAGITTLIDPRGERHGGLGLFEPGLVRGEARLRTDLTWATRWPDLWIGLCGVTLLLGVLAARRGARAPG
ncbi:MAG: apolipoprotein N-acyltransferase [bacterium]